MSNDEKLNFLAGQVTAVTCFLRALAAVHPDDAQLLMQFEERVQMALAATIPTTATEAYLDGFHAQADSLRMR